MVGPDRRSFAATWPNLLQVGSCCSAVSVLHPSAAEVKQPLPLERWRTHPQEATAAISKLSKQGSIDEAMEATWQIAQTVRIYGFVFFGGAQV